MTRGLRNNNPLNIRRNNTKWQGLSATQTDKSFFQFKTMAYGYRAAFKTLQTYILNKYDTDKDGTANELEDVIMRWAPPCENNTEVYIATVEKRSGISRLININKYLNSFKIYPFHNHFQSLSFEAPNISPLPNQSEFGDGYIKSTNCIQWCMEPPFNVCFVPFAYI